MEILPFVTTWVEHYACEQTEKDKYCMVSLICGFFFFKSKLVETESESGFQGLRVRK